MLTSNITFLLAILYLSLLLFTILFQVGLLFGKPWGQWTMGGYHPGKLPIKLRLGALVSIFILLFFALFVVDYTGIFGLQFGFPGFVKWFIIGFNILAVLANSVTKSNKERKLWQPITIAMLLLSLILFLG